MPDSDDFYSHFPSLNVNSYEHRRLARISDDFSEYWKNASKDIQKASPPNRNRRSHGLRHEIDTESSSYSHTPDEIFSAEERNKTEEQRKVDSLKSYRNSILQQIEEAKAKKEREAQQRKEAEERLERNFLEQLAKEKELQQKDPQYMKVFERVSLSENDKDESLNDVSKTSSSSPNNEVYRYFSQSAKTDSDLFNYKKYFKDVLDENQSVLESFEKPEHSVEATAVTKFAVSNDMPKKSKIDSCLTPSHAKCSRCQKILLCRECNDEVPSEATNHLQIEYNKPELSFAEQQVVPYNGKHSPFVFNAADDAKLHANTREQFDENKLANYISLYGDLQKKKLQNEKKLAESKILKEQVFGINPRSNTNSSKKRATRMTSQDLDDILNAAQYNSVIITQTGLARKLLEAENLKN